MPPTKKLRLEVPYTLGKRPPELLFDHKIRIPEAYSHTWAEEWKATEGFRCDIMKKFVSNAVQQSKLLFEKVRLKKLGNLFPYIWYTLYYLKKEPLFYWIEAIFRTVKFDGYEPENCAALCDIMDYAIAQRGVTASSITGCFSYFIQETLRLEDKWKVMQITGDTGYPEVEKRKVVVRNRQKMEALVLGMELERDGESLVSEFFHDFLFDPALLNIVGVLLGCPEQDLSEKMFFRSYRIQDLGLWANFMTVPYPHA